MMEIEVGDVFKYGIFLFQVTEKIDFFNIKCNIIYNKSVVTTSNEHTNTLIKMRKISSLEKELI